VEIDFDTLRIGSRAEKTMFERVLSVFDEE
jgi:hypothetical protein